MELVRNFRPIKFDNIKNWTPKLIINHRIKKPTHGYMYQIRHSDTHRDVRVHMSSWTTLHFVTLASVMVNADAFMNSYSFSMSIVINVFKFILLFFSLSCMHNFTRQSNRMNETNCRIGRILLCIFHFYSGSCVLAQRMRARYNSKTSNKIITLFTLRFMGSSWLRTKFMYKNCREKGRKRNKSRSHAACLYTATE